MSERRMNTTELATHLFCTTQAEEKRQREGIYGGVQARRALLEVRRMVRQHVRELSGTVSDKRMGEKS